MKTYEICFSPTGGTQKVAGILSEAISAGTVHIDLTDRRVDTGSIVLTADEVALVAVPSYSGRVPAVAAERLFHMKGNGARTIIVCVYGNRAYDDTLLELRDILSEAGFSVIAAVAAIAEHSIAHQYATGRPDAEDIKVLEDYASRIRQKIEDGKSDEPKIPGHRPYRKAAGAGIVPKPDKNCVKCGICAARCPVGAIDPENPAEVDRKLCISCMRCVSICPNNARKAGRILTFLAGKMLKKACSERKSSELYI